MRHPAQSQQGAQLAKNGLIHCAEQIRKVTGWPVRDWPAVVFFRKSTMAVSSALATAVKIIPGGRARRPLFNRRKPALTHWAQTFKLSAKLQTKPC
jgi:hypothetical protein